MAYSDKVVEHYENPRNVGSFEKGDDHVGTGMVGAPACGDVMKLQIRVNVLALLKMQNLKHTAVVLQSLHLHWLPSGLKVRLWIKL
jgi:nitrogen fixation NifU-like protein